MAEDSDGGGRQRPRSVGLERHISDGRGGWQRKHAARKQLYEEAENKALLEKLRAIVQDIRHQLERGDRLD